MSAVTRPRGWRQAPPGGPVAAATALLDHMMIIRVLILRSLKTKYLHNPLGLLFEFVQPVVISTVHYYYFSLTGRAVPNNAYLIFTIGGFSIWFCFSAAYMGTYQSMARTGSVTNIPGVTVMHMCLSKAVWAFMLFFAFAIVIAYPWEMLGNQIQPPNFLLSCETYGMAAGLGYGFGMVAHALVEIVPAIGNIVKLFRWALFVTSGIYESLSTMPKISLPIIQCNPLIHLAEYERSAFDPGYPTFYASLAYPAIMMVALIFSGLAVNRVLASRHAAAPLPP
jgi:ABC-type polysaccharide/polyol phosphate export permease